MANRWGNSYRLYFFWGGAPKSLQMLTAANKLKDTCFLEEKLWPILLLFSCSVMSDSLQTMCYNTPGFPVPHHLPELAQTQILHVGKVMSLLLIVSVLKNRDITLPRKGLIVKAMVFTVVMNGCDCWTIKKAERWIMNDFKLWCWRRLFLDCKEIKPVNPKGYQPWIFIRSTDTELKLQHFGHLMGRPDLQEKTLMLANWRQEEKRTTEDEMVGWHQQVDGQEFEQALGEGEGQGSLMCCSLWSCKEPGMIEWLNSKERVSQVK